MEDNAIIELFFARDEAAIAETEKKYAAYLFTVAKNILGNEDAEECVADTYLKAWESIPPSRPSFFMGFLAKITRNASLDRYRANNAKKRAGSQMDVLLSELAEIIPSRADVHAEFENNLIAADINDFLRSLDADTRFVFMRRYWYADAVSTIARGCGYSQSKVKSMLLRTRNKMKAFLG